MTQADNTRSVNWHVVECQVCGAKCSTLTPEKPAICAWYYKHCHAETGWMQRCSLAAGHDGPHVHIDGVET